MYFILFVNNISDYLRHLYRRSSQLKSNKYKLSLMIMVMIKNGYFHRDILQYGASHWYLSELKYITTCFYFCNCLNAWIPAIKISFSKWLIDWQSTDITLSCFELLNIIDTIRFLRVFQAKKWHMFTAQLMIDSFFFNILIANHLGFLTRVLEFFNILKY
jgi:hypothetical protein